MQPPDSQQAAAGLSSRRRKFTGKMKKPPVRIAWAAFVGTPHALRDPGRPDA